MKAKNVHVNCLINKFKIVSVQRQISEKCPPPKHFGSHRVQVYMSTQKKYLHKQIDIYLRSGMTAQVLLNTSY
uniref:Uncharacterized protein n=1 Tax=Anguilla anguilla TaxID=7936 RepID=A0A0E9PT03_ANGAN